MTRSLLLSSLLLLSAGAPCVLAQSEEAAEQAREAREEASPDDAADPPAKEPSSPGEPGGAADGRNAGSGSPPSDTEGGGPREAGGAEPRDGERGSGGAQAPQERGIQFSVETELTYVAPSDLREGRAKLGVGRAGIKVGANRFLGPVKLSLSAGFERSRYDFLEPGDLPLDFSPGRDEPFDDLSTFRLQLGAISFLSRSWSAQLFVSARAGFETDAEIEQSVSLALFVSMGYSFSREFTLTFGIGALTRIEEDPLVIPALGFRWTPTEWLTISVLGPQLSVITKLDPAWSLSFSLGFDNRQFRLDDRRSALAKHVLEDQRVSTQVEANWTPVEWLTLGATLGVALYQELRIRDSKGRSVETLRGDPAPFVGLRIEFTF